MSRMMGKSQLAYLEFVSNLVNSGFITLAQATELLMNPKSIEQILAWLEFKETGLGKELE